MKKLIAVLMVAACALCGCGGHKAIVGKWRTADKNAIVWEFSPNGKVQVGVDEGRYTFGDQNRLKIQTRYASSIYQMEIAGDKMTLRSPTGSALELTRIK